jgi:hypothetical protein
MHDSAQLTHRVPYQQLSFQPKTKDPTLAKVGHHHHDPVKLDVEPSLQQEPKISSPVALDERSNPVKLGVQLSLQPTEPSSPVEPSLPPTQPSSPVQPSLQPSQPVSPNAADGVLSNPVQPHRTPSAEHVAAKVAENRVRSISSCSSFGAIAPATLDANRSWRSNTSVISPSERFAEICAPVIESISCASMRTRFAAARHRQGHALRVAADRGQP